MIPWQVVLSVTVLTAHASAGLEIIHDSLRFYMGRLIDKRQWAFTDYLTIIESLNRVEVDTFSLPLVTSAHQFLCRSGQRSNLRHER